MEPLGKERTLDRVARLIGLRGGDAEADGIPRASLRDHEHRHALITQRAEQSLRYAAHADHSNAFDIDQRDGFDRGEPFYLICRPGLHLDARARMVGSEGVADEDRQIPLDRS